ncbi:chemotaxis protein, partial [Aliarcobacter cryaerophilus]
MLHKINTKKKLLLFPTIFTIIIVLVGNIYTHYSNIANTRNEVAIKTEIFIQDVLKGRISVYQFLRLPNEETAQKTRKIFSHFNKEVLDFKNKLSSEKNRFLSDEIVSNSKKYIEYFDAFSKQKIDNFQNGIKDDTDEIKNIISKMVDVGVILEEKLNEINVSAINLKEESNQFLNSLLLTISIIVILVFLLFSLYISKIIINSIESFKDGLLGFFAYLNREASDTTLLDESNKDEFGQMAKVVNVNILKTKAGIEED